MSESALTISWLGVFLFANLAGLLLALALDPAGFDDSDTRVNARTAWTVAGFWAGMLFATAIPALTAVLRFQGRRWPLWVLAVPLLAISGLTWAILASAVL